MAKKQYVCGVSVLGNTMIREIAMTIKATDADEARWKFNKLLDDMKLREDGITLSHVNVAYGQDCK